jgi:small neutral amino acid transporter SnatA (MarC family)
MDEDLLQFCLKAFVTLIVVVDPLGVAPSLLGIVLAALAVQYVLNGLTGYYDSLVNRSV